MQRKGIDPSSLPQMQIGHGFHQSLNPTTTSGTNVSGTPQQPPIAQPMPIQAQQDQNVGGALLGGGNVGITPTPQPMPTPTPIQPQIEQPMGLGALGQQAITPQAGFGFHQALNPAPQSIGLGALGAQQPTQNLPQTYPQQSQLPSAGNYGMASGVPSLGSPIPQARGTGMFGGQGYKRQWSLF